VIWQLQKIRCFSMPNGIE
ncbi:hypothetical protein D033_0748B, partial [Vibrio parahaemolyticus B-265]